MITDNHWSAPETVEEPLQIPDWLRDSVRAAPVVYVQNDGRDLWKPDAETTAAVNEALAEAMEIVHPGGTGQSGLVKVHVGEPKCHTRMRPEYADGATRFLRDGGANSVVAGDTTVAYTGRRGHKRNPPGDTETYEALAREQGWSVDGPAGIDFVVLDRPKATPDDKLAFEEQHRETIIENDGAFQDFHPAGGYLAADCMVNYAHLTLHGLAGVAACVKSIAMGCASLPGKLRMHQSLRPLFDDELCTRCGLCVENCPEDALNLPDDGSTPAVGADLCIGCGECEAICASGSGAVTLKGREIDDWSRGQQTLPVRMADYTVGLMNGRWDDCVHVLHMYSMTERCDCLDIKQEPMIGRDLGFLVGRNPFAVDRLGGELLKKALEEDEVEMDPELLRTADQVARHAEKTYGILSELDISKIELSK